jgi:hypothetical protein
MSLGRSAGGLPPDYIVQNEAIIKADIGRLVKKYHSDRNSCAKMEIIA